jgi:hypothetical protein
MRILITTRIEGPAALEYKGDIITSVMKGASQLVLLCSYGLALWYGGKLIEEGQMNFLNVTKVSVTRHIHDRSSWQELRIEKAANWNKKRSCNLGDSIDGLLV